jgi:hypothetical protein
MTGSENIVDEQALISEVVENSSDLNDDTCETTPAEVISCS